MDNAKRAMYENYKRLHNGIVGPKTVSSFQQTGTLTPKEFIEAGDALVQKMPVWEWASGNPTVLPFLPPNKKYLVQRGVTCFERPHNADDPSGGSVATDDGDWVSTYPNHVVAAQQVATQQREICWDDDGDDEGAAGGDDDVIAARPCRLYNVYVVYDAYYQTPRMYLNGYSESDPHRELTSAEMKEDVFSENRDKTVSIDNHPFLGCPCISIHPCRHAETMKNIIANNREKFESLQEEVEGTASKEVFVFPTYLSLFVFLKFISSVVPTIRYDISVGMDLM